MSREFIDEERLDEVVGGAFHYYTNSAGKFRCKVDKVGTYYASADAFGAISAHAADVGMDRIFGTCRYRLVLDLFKCDRFYYDYYHP